MEPAQVFDPGQLLTPEDAASFLAIKPETLAHWRTRQQGPAFARSAGRLDTVAATSSLIVMQESAETL